MNSKLIAAALAATLCLSLAACGQTPASSGASGVAASSQAAESAASGEPRTITDLGGHQVTVPAAADIRKIVILSPPVMSFVIGAVPDTEMIVGINARSFLTSNPQIVEKAFPNWQSVESSFVDVNFAVNTESLLALEPDIIFYYGDFQKKGIEGLAIPAVDFLMKGVNSPETMSVAWDGQIRELLGTDTSVGIQQEWDATNAKLAKLLAQVGDEKKTGLCIKLNQAGSLMVMGSDSFDGWAQSFFALSGIENAAASIEGTGEVSMEQILLWNPEAVVLAPDSCYDDIWEDPLWANVRAVKTGAVYEVPDAPYNWLDRPPSVQRILGIRWLGSLLYPQAFQYDMVKEAQTFYKLFYHYDLT